MKNVAATSGQNVSFATPLLAVEIARAGIWTGRDKELNFYSRPPKRFSLARWVKRVRIRRIQGWSLHATKKCISPNIFFVAEKLALCTGPLAQASAGAPASANASLRSIRSAYALC
jgi:hypothetical protein